MNIVINLDNNTKDLEVFIGEAKNLSLNEKMAHFTTIISELICSGYESLLKDEAMQDEKKDEYIARACVAIYVDTREKMHSLGISRQDIEDRADYYMLHKMFEKVED